MESYRRPYKDFEFNLRELAGSMGDFGTLFPLTLALITVAMSVGTNKALGFAVGLLGTWLLRWLNRRGFVAAAV